MGKYKQRVFIGVCMGEDMVEIYADAVSGMQELDNLTEQEPWKWKSEAEICQGQHGRNRESKGEKIKGAEQGR